MKFVRWLIPAFTMGWLEPAAAQVDSAVAARYFREARTLCERDGGQLWGISLCGPMVIADGPSKTLAASQPVPDGRWPAALGYANAALLWGEQRWSTYVWSLIPADNPRARAILLLHELFHRVQQQLGLFVNDRSNEHLDTLEGRYWLQLEWRALARAIATTGPERSAAVRDALAFRLHRRGLFPGSAESERRMEINEAVAQYTGIVIATPSRAEATAEAIALLKEYEQQPSFVRTFPYPMAAYGLLLDGYLQGWRRGIKAGDDLAQMVMAAAPLSPSPDVGVAARRYGGGELRSAEVQRDSVQRVRVAELRQRFVEGPVLVVPNGRMNAFMTNGMTALPGAGIVYPGFRTTGDWGSLEGDWVRMASDRSTLTVPGPFTSDGGVLKGEGWTVTPAEGWSARPGSRAGDFVLAKDSVSVPPAGPLPAAPNRAAAPSEIVQALERYLVVSRVVNARAMADFYAPGAMLFEPGIRPIVTRDSIFAFMSSFPGVKVLTATATADTIEVFGETAYLWGSYFERLEFPGQPQSSQHGKFVMQWVRRDGRWLIQRHFRVPMPDPR